jgi:hypothetical protein
VAGILLMLLSWVGGELVDGHVHVAPHGGKIAHLGALHLEMRVEESRVRIWLLDQQLKAVPPKSLSLQVTISPKDRPKQVLSLVPEGDHFAARAELVGLPTLQVTAALTTRGKRAQTSFRWTILDARERIDDSDPIDGQKL